MNGATLNEVRAAIGSGVDVLRFVKFGCEVHRATFSGSNPYPLSFKESPRPLREVPRQPDEIKVCQICQNASRTRNGAANVRLKKHECSQERKCN